MCYNARKKSRKAEGRGRGGEELIEIPANPTHEPNKRREKRARVEGKGAGGRGASRPLDTYPNITK
jgi:hypothetical protein